MKRWWLSLCALALLVSCSEEPPENPPAPEPKPPEEQPDGPGKTYDSRMDRVVDGDTVHLKEPVSGSTKVRMLSIDAPETDYQGQSQGKHGEEATAYLKQLLPEGTEVKIVLGEEEKDDYGRLLAHIGKGKTDINEEMIRQGKAVPYFIYPNFDRFEEYRKALKEAVAEKRGIWNPEDPLKELPFEFRLRVGNRKPDKFVGDFATKEYVAPEKYREVPLENRVFFWREEDAKRAGYTKR